MVFVNSKLYYNTTLSGQADGTVVLGAYAMDIALVELTEDVSLSDNIKPVEVDWQNKVHLENGLILAVSINILNTVFQIYFKPFTV